MILYLFIKLLFIVILTNSFVQFKYSFRTSYIIITIVHLVIFFVGCTIYWYKGYYFLGYITPIVVTIPSYFCFLFLSKQKSFKFFFTLLTVSNFNGLKSYIGYLSLFVFKNFAFRAVIEIICFMLILILVYKVIRNPYFKIQNTLDKGWGLLCLVPILVNVILYTIQYSTVSIKTQSVSIALVLLINCMMLVFYATFYLNFENISEYFNLSQDKKLIQVQTDLQKIEYGLIMEKISAIQIYRHDMRHNIQVLNTFLNDNDISEAKKYLGKLNDNLNNTIVEKYCANYCVNAILSSYIDKAKSEKINVTHQVEISENIKIDDMDIGLIFANALENAIFACKKIENYSDRKTNIVCKEHFDQIYIQISNTFIGNVLFEGEYPVSNEVDHGIGTRSIAAIAEKHGGVFSFTTVNNVFKATVILNYK